MGIITIDGGNPLEGELVVHGSKNSVLPILAGVILSDSEECVIKNCPKISDVDTAIELLKVLGCKIKKEENVLTIDSSCTKDAHLPESLMREMRSSIVFLGAIISKNKKAVISYPGGCELGPRPIDMHISSLRKLGVVINEEHGFLNCSAPKRLQGCDIDLPFPSVGATENIILAAVKAKGTTTIVNAAKEPEIEDLQNFLNKMGAKVSGAGTSIIRIDGVEKLTGCEYTIMPDRIVAATYILAGAMIGKEILVKDINALHLSSFFSLLRDTKIDMSLYKNCIKIKGNKPYLPAKFVRTMPYPGFPTDIQAPFMAMMCYAQGTSVFIENIFDARFKHVSELNRMGANIKTEGKIAIVEGVKRMTSANVKATDLRGGACMVLAALKAEGKTQISDVYHIDRGYEEIEKVLSGVGAKISRG